MSSPGEQQKAVEFTQKLLRAADFIGETLLFRMPDPSLNTIFVQPSENLVKTWFQIEVVDAVRTSRLETATDILV